MIRTRLTEAEGRKSLLNAATEIVTRTGSPNFTVREVAALAGINHGLVHRYFGTKDALVDAVIDEISTTVANDLGTDGGCEAVNSDGTGTLARLIAHAMLSERVLVEPDLRLRPSPIADLLVRRCRDDGKMPEHDARVVAAQIMALIMGWRLNEPFLIASCDLGEQQVDVLRKELFAACLRLAQSRSAANSH